MAAAATEGLLSLLVMSHNRFTYGLEQVPEDRLNWSPGGSAKTPLQLAGSVAGFLTFVAAMVADGRMPERSGDPPAAPETRPEARRRLDAAFANLQQAVANQTDESLARTVTAPWRAEIPVRDFLWMVASVVGYWQGQLNYLQLAYGDTNANIPPDWGQEAAA